jgi:hypothetical protein
MTIVLAHGIAIFPDVKSQGTTHNVMTNKGAMFSRAITVVTTQNQPQKYQHTESEKIPQRNRVSYSFHDHHQKSRSFGGLKVGVS